MNAVVIVSKNQDFTEVVAGLIRKELDIACHIVENKEESKEWPDALVITDENLPVRMQEILGKIRSGLSKADEEIAIGEWKLSTRLKTLSGKGASIDLTDKEVQLLQCLADAGKQGMEREALLRRVWGFEPDINTHTLETHIYRLRTKLKEAGITTNIIVESGAYRFTDNI